MVAPVVGPMVAPVVGPMVAPVVGPMVMGTRGGCAALPGTDARAGKKDLDVARPTGDPRGIHVVRSRTGWASSA